MGGRPQKREKASGRKEWELGSTWNLKWTHVGIGFVVYVLRGYRFTLSPFYVGTLVQVYAVLVLRCPRFTLVQVYGFTVLRLKRLKMGRGYVKRVLRWDVGTFRPPLHYLTLFSCDRNWRSCGKYTRDNFSVVRDNF